LTLTLIYLTSMWTYWAPHSYAIRVCHELSPLPPPSWTPSFVLENSSSCSWSILSSLVFW